MTIPAGTLTGAIINRELGRPDATQLILPNHIWGLAGVTSGTLTIPTDIVGKNGIDPLAPGAAAFVETNGVTITIPGTIKVDYDLAILFDMAIGASSIVTPSGFTAIEGIVTSGDGGVGIRIRSSYRILRTGDASRVLTGQSGSETNRKILGVVRCALPIASVSVGSWATNGGGSSLGAIGVAASDMVPNCVVAGFAGAWPNAASFSASGGSVGTNWSFSAVNNTGAIRGAMVGATRNETDTGVTYTHNDNSNDALGLAGGVLNLSF